MVATRRHYERGLCIKAQDGTGPRAATPPSQAPPPCLTTRIFCIACRGGDTSNTLCPASV
eukprot:5947918-Pyramimonas_sp.AAC.1